MATPRSRALVRVGLVLLVLGAIGFAALWWLAALPVNPDGTRSIGDGLRMDPALFAFVGLIAGGLGGTGLVLLLAGLLRGRSP